MIDERNREIIRQLYQSACAKKRPETGDRPRKMGFTQYTVSERHSSLKAFHKFFDVICGAFPDYDLNIENMVLKNDRVMVRYTIYGTHKGDFMGLAPTNERVAVTGIDVFRLDNGKVVEHWDAAHQVSALPQLIGQPVRADMRSQPNNATAAITG
jgi:predicted ester cyclase